METGPWSGGREGEETAIGEGFLSEGSDAGSLL